MINRKVSERERVDLIVGGEAIDGRHSVEDMVVSHIYATGFGFGTTRPGGSRVRLLGSVRRDT